MIIVSPFCFLVLYILLELILNQTQEFQHEGKNNPQFTDQGIGGTMLHYSSPDRVPLQLSFTQSKKSLSLPTTVPYRENLIISFLEVMNSVRARQYIPLSILLFECKTPERIEKETGSADLC